MLEFAYARPTCAHKSPKLLQLSHRPPTYLHVPGDAGHGAIPISFVVDAEVVVATQGVCQTGLRRGVMDVQGEVGTTWGSMPRGRQDQLCIPLRRIPAVCGTVAQANVEAWIIHTK